MGEEVGTRDEIAGGIETEGSCDALFEREKNKVSSYRRSGDLTN